MTSRLAKFWKGWVLLFLCGRFLLGPASAHDPALTAVKVIRDTNRTVVSVSTHISALERETGAVGNQRLEAALRGRLRLELDGAPLNPGAGRLQLDSVSDLLHWQWVEPRPIAQVRLAAPLIVDDPTAFTVLQVYADGLLIAEQLLDSTTSAPPPIARPWDSFRFFFNEGLRHIAGGFDHLAFVLGLVLVARRTRNALLAATGFTLAHSLTLAATVLGWVAPNPALVETLVATSISLVAAEALWGGTNAQRRLGWHALGFGLVHGMAFASAITALMSGRSNLLPALFGFNTGVECGQALFVATTAPLLAWLCRHQPNIHGHVHRWLASATGLAGLWWLGGRLADWMSG